ncbi:hypothetical protein O1W71_01955 [Microbacterium sp. H37-C3]|uniref:hypothetical protein n=1 Tax=Microbacterium sp. H37-C3 TaxID=3004354 RepID=UPI0022AE53FD|nr:hypothetical protein [Microbacterium sp. H37-C3]MCZ4066432.1 hypothetical protein [Microbacterium sp. H37-C3]
MSLLDRNAAHVVLVQLQKSERDERGRRIMRPYGKRIRVRCSREPVRDWSSAEETTSGGLQVLDLTIIKTRRWPGDIHSLVFWNGQMHETVGVPQDFSRGKRTKHWRITVKWVGEDPDPDAQVEPDPEFDRTPPAETEPTP